jgi:hypothetical protein
MGKIPEWNLIRYIGASIPARLTVIFPLIANIAIFNDSIVAQFSGESVIFRGVPGLLHQFQLYIWFTFAGLLFFSIGQIVFTVSCPHLIKTHDCAESFLESLNSNVVSKALLLKWARYAENSAHINNDEKSEDGIASAIALLEGEAFRLPDMSEQLVNITRLYYKSVSLDFPILRFICSLFFTVGVVLVFYPSVKTVVNASVVVSRGFWGS